MGPIKVEPIVWKGVPRVRLTNLDPRTGPLVLELKDATLLVHALDEAISASWAEIDAMPKNKPAAALVKDDEPLMRPVRQWRNHIGSFVSVWRPLSLPWLARCESHGWATTQRTRGLATQAARHSYLFCQECLRPFEPEAAKVEEAFLAAGGWL
jgi:hypothetical protein